jgi:hypothetical protein
MKKPKRSAEEHEWRFKYVDEVATWWLAFKAYCKKEKIIVREDDLGIITAWLAFMDLPVTERKALECREATKMVALRTVTVEGKGE